MAQPVRLGDLLLRAGVISDQQLQRALEEQKRWGGRLGTILVRMGSLSEDLLVKALSKQLGVPRANLDAINVPGPLLARIPRDYCERKTLVPLGYLQERRTLLVAIVDPLDVQTLDDLGKQVGLTVEPYLAGEQSIRAAIARIYTGVQAQRGPATDPGLRMVNNQGDSLSGSPGAPGQRLATHIDRPAVVLPGEAGTDLQAMAERQSQAVRAVIELLIEKGVISRDEYLSWLQR